MLRYLSIRNFVIVDQVDQEFERGFTVLTGETGAGKSILIGALALVLGDRGEADLVRRGGDKAEVQAEFDIRKHPELRTWLKENDLEGDGDICLLRRVIDASGRSRAFLNGHVATVQQLRAIGEVLVDIHGQHAHQSLLKSDEQRALLDAYAGLESLAREVDQAYRQWQDTREQRLAWEQNAQAFAAEREELEWQTRELETLNFKLEDWNALLADHARLSHAAALLEGVEYSLDTLMEGERACSSQMQTVLSRLQALLEYDARLSEVAEALQSSAVQLEEAAYTLRHYRDHVDLDPQRLQAIEQRMEAVHGCARKYRTAPENLPALLEKCQARLAQLQVAGSTQDWEQKEKVLVARYREYAGKLGAGRERAAQTLSEQVSSLMQTLAMAGGRFAVVLTPLEGGNSHGLESIEFCVAAHADMPLKPLAKVASGGELSRISLAIQVVASKVAKVPTLIFDEVDAGIGGKVAEIVGEMLKKLGHEHQVLCITHLPQVAACGDHHWRISKEQKNDGVSSRITVLSGQDRVEEVARMLGGRKITETTRSHAQEIVKTQSGKPGKKTA